MQPVSYRSRKAIQLENENLRITVLVEGAHVAEIFHKQTGVNPLWTPPWESIEPSLYDPRKYPGYGSDSESKLLAGIMGHNLCLDLFGSPSPEERDAGLTVHGEASVATYHFARLNGGITASADLPLAELHFERHIQLNGPAVEFREIVSNRSSYDRPIAWTQHVTLGPPFLERGRTQLRIPSTHSRTYESDFGDLYKSGMDFGWPNAPARNGATIDLQTFTSAESSAGYTAHLLDPKRAEAFFLAWSPSAKLLFGYRWKRADFPWIGMWIENHSRKTAPWNGKTLTCGMEFGVSPMPETRRAMIQRGSLFGVPAYRWLPAKSSVEVSYSAITDVVEAAPNHL